MAFVEVLARMTSLAVGDRDHFYFGPDDRLYGVAAGAPTARRALLVAAPIGNEGVHARRVLWRLLSSLSEAGHAGLVIDLRGSGESDGAFAETTVERIAEDVADGLAELARRYPAAEQRVLAFRYAAVGALQGPLDDVAGVLLIDPCLNPAAALNTDLRLELVRQMRRRGAPREDRAAMLARRDAGDAIIVDGQVFSPELYRGLVDAGGPATGERLGGRLTVLKSGPATFEQFYGHVAGRFADQAPAFERTVLDWMDA
jgi:nucleotide-binding universal stress UspA family protein